MNLDHINREWHQDLPHSFGGKYRSYEHYNDIGKQSIDNQFKKNDIYSRFKQYRRLKYYNPVYVYRKREQFQADTIVFNDPLMMQATGNIRYLLIVIDVYTKYAWLFPLKEIKGVNVAQCLQSLFLENKPEKFTTDAGKEFLNRNVRDVLSQFDVQHFIAKSKNKASVAERFNLTIQRLIYQLCRYHNTNDWTLDIVLEKAKKIYLNRKHRTIKMTPTQAEQQKNQSKLRKIYREKYVKANKRKRKPKFKVGDTVRISSTRTRFERGYHQKFTTEVWTIHKVLDNLPQPRYTVKDERGDDLDCILHENELVAYEPSGVYEIEKILKTRWRKGKKEALVRWLHYDASFDSWVPAKDLSYVL